MNIQVADKMLNKFKSEKEKCEKKLDKLSNEKSKENLKKYIKEIWPIFDVANT